MPEKNQNTPEQCPTKAPQDTAPDLHCSLSGGILDPPRGCKESCYVWEMLCTYEFLAAVNPFELWQTLQQERPVEARFVGSIENNAPDLRIYFICESHGFSGMGARKTIFRGVY